MQLEFKSRMRGFVATIGAASAAAAGPLGGMVGGLMGKASSQVPGMGKPWGNSKWLIMITN